MAYYTFGVVTLTLIPGAVAVHIGNFHDQRVGIMTLVGSGTFSETTLEVVLDAPTLAALEASLGEARQQLRTASAER